MKQFKNGKDLKVESGRKKSIQEISSMNYTIILYGDEKSFLQHLTEATDKLWGILQGLQKEERKKGGVLDMDTDIVSSLTSHGPYYISEETKDLE